MDNRRVLGVVILFGAIYIALTRRQQIVGYAPGGAAVLDGPMPAGLIPAATGATPAAAAAAAVEAERAMYGAHPYVSTQPSTGAVLTRTGLSAGTALGTAAVTAGTVSAAALAATGIGAAAALLTWAIGSKGLFRGGEEALQVNPARDQFLAQFGAAGWGPDGGAPRLAAALSEITGEPDGSHYFKALMTADHMDEFVPATREIKAVLGAVGIEIGAF